MLPSLPAGTITFLFTDIEGSTELFEQQPLEMKAALARHHAILQGVIEAHQGYVFQIVGDAFCAAFHTARQGLEAALKAQRGLLAESWEGVDAVWVRMGLHTGAAEVHLEQVVAGQYSGHETLARTQRIMAAGHGGQILLSAATVGLLGSLPEGVSLRDMGARRLKGIAQPERLFQAVAQDLPADFPPLKTPEFWPNNLPRQLTSFIGREAELAGVKALLRQLRLVTLTGAGGCGKTRLATEAAAEMIKDYADGAWLVELAAISDPALVAQAVCSVLGLRPEGSRPAEEALVAYLQEKNALLVLDNCEHLVEACARIAEALLRNCPRVSILASSREALNVAGEAIYRVTSLSLPGGESVEAVLSSEAGRLFVERAGTLLPGYSATTSNAAAITQVCRRLDGIPLAIELAAARINVLRVEQIAARLADVFTLLTGGSRTSLPHHQTLRLTIDWSYRLLGEPERILLQRLAVFAGGWTLEAAEFVCVNPEASGMPEPIAAGEILDLLSRLVDKSLVIVDRLPGQEARYTLYETIRRYALEIPPGGGEHATLRERHLEYYLQLAEQADPEIHGWEQAAWLRRLEQEHPNLRLALEWALERRPVAGLRIAAALVDFWDAHGHFAEGAAWLERTLAATQDDPPTATRVQARMMLLALSSRQGIDMERFKLELDENITLAQAIGDSYGLSRSLHLKGLMLDYQGAPGEEVKALEAESLRLVQEAGDRLGTGQALGPLAARALKEGDFARAVAIYSESLALFEAVGDQREIAGALWNLAEVRLAAGEEERAREQASASLALYQELSDRHGVATTLRTLGKLAMNHGEPLQAQAQLEESEALFKELDDSECLAETRLNLGRLMLAVGDAREAEAYALACLSTFRTSGHRLGMAQALGVVGRAALVRGDAPAARLAFEEGLGLLGEAGDPAEKYALQEGLKETMR